jgi:hypothetical protein
VEGLIQRKYHLVEAIISQARNIVEGVRFICTMGLFCPCCGMQLRLTPSSRECKEILRKRKNSSRTETIA